MAQDGKPEVEVPQQNQEAKAGTESVPLDLDAHGDMEVTTSGGKPTFEKVTKAVIEEAVLMTSKDKKTQKNKDGTEQDYYPVFLKLTYDIGGQKAYENLGGAKMYIGDDGKPAKFHVGKDSALGKLKALIEDNFDFDGTVKEVPEIVKGQSVGIKTVTSEVGGETYQKNLVQVFYK